MDKSELPIKAVGTSFEVLKTVARLERAELEAITASVSVTKSTVYKHLRTLEMLGYVERQGKEYFISEMNNALANPLKGDDHPTGARTIVAKLASSTGDLAGFFLLQETRGVAYTQQTGDVLAGREFDIQMTPYLHASAAGKAILAGLPDDRVASIVDTEGLPALTENTITDLGTLKEELNRIGNRGFALEREEQADGVRGISVPFERPDDRLGAIYVVGPIDRMGSKRFEQDLPGILLSAVDRSGSVTDKLRDQS